MDRSNKVAEQRLYTTRVYPCGCKAEGPGDVPSYCPKHGDSLKPSYSEMKDALEQLAEDCCGQGCNWVAAEALGSEVDYGKVDY